MITVLALWLCGLCAVSLYRSIPEKGMRQDIYDVTLGVMSASVLVVSATVLVVSLISPPGVHPVGLPPGWAGW
jgi:hypothetical protein